MRDYKLTTRQTISAVIFSLVFGVLFLLPDLIGKYSESTWKYVLIEAPGIYVYYLILILGVFIIDRYSIGLFGKPITKEQVVEVSYKRTAKVLALIPLSILIIIAVLLLS